MKKGLIIWDTHFYGLPNTRKIFFDYKSQKNNSLNVFKCCFPSWVWLCIAVIIDSFDNWVTQNNISSNSMFYIQGKQCVTFIDILGDSLVIWVTGFGKIRNIILPCFIFDGRGVSGMCVYDSFYPFSWLNRDCSLQWAVPFIGRRRYLGTFCV